MREGLFLTIKLERNSILWQLAIPLAVGGNSACGRVQFRLQSGAYGGAYGGVCVGVCVWVCNWVCIWVGLEKAAESLGG